jgi:hypothetical protein
MKSQLVKYLVIATTTLLSGLSYGDEFDQAPPSFNYKNTKAVAVDFQRVELMLSCSSRSTGYASVQFVAGDEGGYPMFDLVPSIARAKLNSRDIDANLIPTVNDPDGVTRLRVLESHVEAGSSNLLEIWFDASYMQVQQGRCRQGFFMTDLGTGGRGFWEQYAPASFEYDHFPMTLTFRIEGVQKTHEVFSNGQQTKLGENSWEIQFPDYYTTSSFFLHVSDKGRFDVQRGTFQGVNGAIPVVAYAASRDLSTKGLSRSLSILAELEDTFGPYAHSSLVAYITSGGGGMEHAGATITSLWALGHEITHSWFARGVMPANGNSGWIDEAIASWRDEGYPRASSEPFRNPVQMSGFSPYRRHTSRAAYTLGMKLISEFDYMGRDFEYNGKSGMKGILSQLFLRHARTSITVEYFQEFMEAALGRSLGDVFNRYVRGQNDQGHVMPEVLRGHDLQSHHPRPFTKAELKKLH